MRASATKLLAIGPDRGSFIVVLLDDNTIMLARSQPCLDMARILSFSLCQA
jgi:hypothetical protein